MLISWDHIQWGWGIFIYVFVFCVRLFISFVIDCFYGLWTRIYEFGRAPPSRNYRSWLLLLIFSLVEVRYYVYVGFYWLVAWTMTPWHQLFTVVQWNWLIAQSQKSNRLIAQSASEPRNWFPHQLYQRLSVVRGFTTQEPLVDQGNFEQPSQDDFINGLLSTEQPLMQKIRSKTIMLLLMVQNAHQVAAKLQGIKHVPKKRRRNWKARKTTPSAWTKCLSKRHTRATRRF